MAKQSLGMLQNDEAKCDLLEERTVQSMKAVKKIQAIDLDWLCGALMLDIPELFY